METHENKVCRWVEGGRAYIMAYMSNISLQFLHLGFTAWLGAKFEAWEPCLGL